MSRFSVGQSVEIRCSESCFHGDKGVIAEVLDEDEGVYRVLFEDFTSAFHSSELVPWT